MKKFTVVLVMAVMLMFSAPVLWAADAPDVRDSDSVSDVLKRSEGKSVELVLVSGEKLAGKLQKVTSHLVHLSGLRGMEFYDAVVRVETISAVIVRVKG